MRLNGGGMGARPSSLLGRPQTEGSRPNELVGFRLAVSVMFPAISPLESSLLWLYLSGESAQLYRDVVWTRAGASSLLRPMTYWHSFDPAGLTQSSLVNLISAAGMPGWC